MGKLAPSWQTLAHPIRNTALVSLVSSKNLNKMSPTITLLEIGAIWTELGISYQNFIIFLPYILAQISKLLNKSFY